MLAIPLVQFLKNWREAKRVAGFETNREPPRRRS